MTRASFIRSFLKRGTAVLTSTFLLLALARGGESKNTDSFAEAPHYIVYPVWGTVKCTTTTQCTSTKAICTTQTEQLSQSYKISSHSTTTTMSTTMISSTTTTTVLCSTSTASSVSQSMQGTTTTSCTSSVSYVGTTSGTEIKQVASLPVTAREYELLCKIVANEYGGMKDVYERAKIVASVMNQSYRTGMSIESCLNTFCVPWGFNPYNTYYCGVHYTTMSDAVDYYFANKNTVFAGWQADSWYGSGYGTNIFHRQI